MCWSALAFPRIYVCDRPERFEAVKEEMSSKSSYRPSYQIRFPQSPQTERPDFDLAGEPNITVMKDGHHVSRISDFIIYSVEAEYISAVVKEYGPCELTRRMR